MKRYKLLIFDFDGTLAATEPAIQFCMKTAFTEYGLTPPAETAVRNAIGIPLTEMIARLGCLDNQTAAEITEIYRKYYVKEGMELTALFPESYATVEKLYEKGYTLAVVSNKKDEVVKASVEKTGLTRFFGLVSGEGEGKFAKPDKRLFSNVLAPYFGIDKSGCLMIGDAVQDTGFAQNSGMDSVWAAYGFGSKNDCMNPSVKYVIDNIGKLADILV